MFEIRLWSHYADGHRGVAIEIDFPDEGDENLYQVSYVEELGAFGSTILGSPMPQEVLSLKTEGWEYEAEYRIIQRERYYPILGRISAVYLGQRVSDLHASLLAKCIPASISIASTNINDSTLRVDPGDVVERGKGRS